MTNKQDPKSTEASQSDELADDDLATVAGGILIAPIGAPSEASENPTAAGKIQMHDISFVKIMDKSSP